MKVTLKDGAPRKSGQAEINVSKNGNILEIGAAGVEPAPIVIEFYEDALTIRVYEGDPDKGGKQLFKGALALKPTAPTQTEDTSTKKSSAKSEPTPAPAPEPAPEPATGTLPSDDELAAFDAA
ncbi:hypothetical protein SAMN05444166_4180 [Singulisphaera sp. GP187]|uniref:hypothetical protein n=1 Tax=Singulisphaera sp. GP187 TaxID=1882752 RepID=UPI0009281777|nr:hypothetical protein [Singulisphaera sp. GP187]SIO37282.1 hypothetical protein SAMN05444166_4180 [Singulisphaera sp. GP187]